MYDFTALEDYFKRTNQWKGLTEDEKILQRNRTTNGYYPDLETLIESVEQMLKERNLP